MTSVQPSASSTSLQTTPTTTTTTPTITIKKFPSQSRACRHLIKGLDDEVESLYPDHADFPYEGAGTWLTQDEDEDDGGVKTDAEAAADEELFFFVAFASPVAPQTPSPDGEDDDGDDKNGAAAAVGCVGLRHLPYFPSHRAPASASSTRPVSSDQTRQGRSSTTSPPTVELKRMYVQPGYRGRQAGQTVAGSGESVAARLLKHAEEFARDRLKAQRLVLETGARQTAAMNLYQRHGWTRRKEFGDYVGAGEDVGGLSRCFEKWL